MSQEAAHDEELALQLARLRAPPYLTDRAATRWPHASAQQAAADRLGALGDARAVPALIDALNDPHVNVRVHAIRALGVIGDASAVGSLIPFLGVRYKLSA